MGVRVSPGVPTITKPVETPQRRNEVANIKLKNASKFREPKASHGNKGEGAPETLTTFNCS